MSEENNIESSDSNKKLEPTIIQIEGHTNEIFTIQNGKIFFNSFDANKKELKTDTNYIYFTEEKKVKIANGNILDSKRKALTILGSRDIKLIVIENNCEDENKSNCEENKHKNDPNYIYSFWFNEYKNECKKPKVLRLNDKQFYVNNCLVDFIEIGFFMSPHTLNIKFNNDRNTFKDPASSQTQNTNSNQPQQQAPYPIAYQQSQPLIHPYNYPNVYSNPCQTQYYPPMISLNQVNNNSAQNQFLNNQNTNLIQPQQQTHYLAANQQFQMNQMHQSQSQTSNPEMCHNQFQTQSNHPIQMINSATNNSSHGQFLNSQNIFNANYSNIFQQPRQSSCPNISNKNQSQQQIQNTSNMNQNQLSKQKLINNEQTHQEFQNSQNYFLNQDLSNQINSQNSDDQRSFEDIPVWSHICQSPIQNVSSGDNLSNLQQTENSKNEQVIELRVNIGTPPLQPLSPDASSLPSPQPSRSSSDDSNQISRVNTDDLNSAIEMITSENQPYNDADISDHENEKEKEEENSNDKKIQNTTSTDEIDSCSDELIRCLAETKHGTNEKRKQGKAIGKDHYFTQNFKFSSDKEDETDPTIIKEDPINELPNIKLDFNGEMDTSKYDEYKYELYDYITTCYECIRNSYDFYRKTNDKLVEFQIKAEEKFIEIIGIMTKKFEHIGALDYTCDRITESSQKYLLNYQDIYNLLKRPPSRGKASVKSSADLFQLIKNNENENENENSNNSVTVKAYHPSNRSKVNKKLELFYQGKYNEETHYSYEISEIEASVIISYCTESRQVKDKLISEIAYVMFNRQERAHFLYLRNISVNTGFYLPVTAMYFHHDDKNDTNKLYLCGDNRIKEFTIEGLDSINDSIKKDDQIEVTISNTNTYYFCSRKGNSSVITVWDDKLVFGCSNELFIWNISNNEKEKEQTNEINVDEIDEEPFGIDYDKVDLTRGKSYEKKIQLLDHLQDECQISSLAVLKISSSNQTFLAVSFLKYPIIYIYNENYDIISRLIAHTMDITCLKSYNNFLFSGSLDLTARMWNINKGAPEIYVDTRNQKIKAIEPSSFMNNIILFTGGEDSTVQCFNITEKKSLFEFKFNKNLVIDQISFITNEEQNDHAKLMIITKDTKYNSNLGILYKYHIHYFEF